MGTLRDEILLSMTEEPTRSILRTKEDRPIEFTTDASIK
jgi:hypothetical protein